MFVIYFIQASTNRKLTISMTSVRPVLSFVDTNDEVPDLAVIPSAITRFTVYISVWPDDTIRIKLLDSNTPDTLNPQLHYGARGKGMNHSTERRKSIRKVLRIPGRVSYCAVRRGEAHLATIHNLSSGGAFLAIPRAPHLNGTIVRVHIGLARSNVIVMYALVVRSDHHGLGVIFASYQRGIYEQLNALVAVAQKPRRPVGGALVV